MGYLKIKQNFLHEHRKNARFLFREELEKKWKEIKYERLNIILPFWNQRWYKTEKEAYEKDWWSWDYNYFNKDIKWMMR